MEDTEKAANDPENAAVAKGIPVSFSKNDESSFEGVIFSSSPILDLSQRGLCHLGELFKVPTLQVSVPFLGGCAHRCLQPEAESALGFLFLLLGEVNSRRSGRVSWGFTG